MMNKSFTVIAFMAAVAMVAPIRAAEAAKGLPPPAPGNKGALPPGTAADKGTPSPAADAKGPPPPAAAKGAAPSAEELLKASDRARGAAKDGITWKILVETTDDGKDNSVDYLVKVKGDNALAEAIAPARNKGEMMLFNDRNLWFFKPGIKKPVAISPRQKLMGQAANGDIASTNYARDYEGVIVGEEAINGEDAYKMELKAKAKNVTYDRIRYWVGKKSRLGVHAEFLTVSGDVFKRAAFEYKNTMTGAGGSYPFVSKMLITDAVNPSLKTTISYQEPKRAQHADSIFNVNNLLR